MKYKLIACIALATLLGALMSSTGFAADEWPMFRGNVSRTGEADPLNNTLDLRRPYPVWIFPAPAQTVNPIDEGGTWTLSLPGTPGHADGAYADDADGIDDYRWATVSTTETSTTTWTFTVDADGAPFNAGSYYISVWFPYYDPTVADAKEPTTDARYTVTIGGTVAGTFSIDQTYYGGDWVVLGDRPFEVGAGDTIEVELSNQTGDSASFPDRIVIADAVKVEQTLGTVLSSPVVARDAGNSSLDKVITCVNELRPLPVTDRQDGFRDVGVIYGLAGEDDGATAADDRGRWDTGRGWRFPASTDNWIEGGISSTPTVEVVKNAGPISDKMVAFAPAGDGQVYAIDVSNGGLVWQGPGYIVDNPDSTNGGWVAGAHSGYQGAGYVHIAATATAGGTASASWRFDMNNAGSYAIYAWIPPSTTAERYISDARYTVIGTLVGTEVKDVNVTIDQGNGGRWVRLGNSFKADSGATIVVQLTNETALNGSYYVAADAVKVVPADLGSFEFSSPVVEVVNNIVDPTNNGTYVYIASTSGRVYKLKVGENDPVWTYPDPNESPAITDPDDPKYPAPQALGAIYASPALDASTNTLYIGSADGHVYALNTSTGQRRWVFPSKKPYNEYNDVVYTLGEISGTVAIGTNDIYVGIGGGSDSGYSFDTSGRVIAIPKSITDGANPVTAVRWFPDPALESKGAFVYSSPLLTSLSGTPSLVVASTDGYLYALDPATLAQLPAWTTPSSLGDGMYSSPSGVKVSYSDAAANPVGSAAFVGAGSSIHGIKLADGIKDWNWELLGDITASPAICGERIYIGDEAGYTWAFSTRYNSGNPNNQDEEWNEEIVPEPPTSGSDTNDPMGHKAVPEIDVFTKEQFDAFKAAVAADTQIDPNTMHDDPPGFGAGPPPGDYYEWGDSFYFIIWNLLNPNRAADGTFLKPDDPEWKKNKTDSSVSIFFKNRGPGDDSDSTEKIPVFDGQKGYFKDAAGNAVFYAAVEHRLDAVTAHRTHTPGTRITVYVQETPKNSRDTKGESVVPVHPVPKDGSGDYLRDEYDPREFSINNPLALAYTDPGGIESPSLVGISTSSPTFSTSRDNPAARINGNAGLEPYLRPLESASVDGGTAHGTTTSPMRITVLDRSLLGKIGLSIKQFMVECHDLLWTGGPGMVINPILAWEVLPPYAGPNGSEDYPDIPAEQISCAMDGSGIDPAHDRITLASVPGLAAGGSLPAPGTEWNAQQNQMNLSISVPRFQPANLPNAATSTLLRSSGYTARVYAFVDTNRNGRLDKPGALGATKVLRRKVTGASAEAYREFFVQVHVPPDRRVEIAERTIDIGQVPHTFGLVADANNGPVAFHDTLMKNLEPAPDGFQEWFKPFTAYNVGNTNLLNVRLHEFQPSSIMLPGLVSDSVQSGVIPGSAVTPATSPGERDPYGACVISALDPMFWTDPGYKSVLGSGQPRTFHKARVGGMATELRIPDVPDRELARFGNPTRTSPSLSVAVPFGQPVGTYYGKVTLFEDVNDSGKFDDTAAETVGNPVMTLAVSVTEARLTDGYTPGARPHIDSGPSTGGGNKSPAGDMMPAAYWNADTGINLIWASSRYNTDPPSATDPWYLYLSTLGWDTGRTPPQWGSPMSTGTLGDSLVYSNRPTFFPGAGMLVENSVRFFSPSVATSATGSWLFFGAQGHKDSGIAGMGNQGRSQESRIFYTPIIEGIPDENSALVTLDWTMPKFGPRGIAATPGLWCFWYGGNNDRWRIYYNANATPNDPSGWTNPAQLPIPRGLTSTAEPSPVFWPVLGAGSNLLDVIYSGYSSAHGNSDIYLSRYDAPGTVDPRGGHMQVALTSLGLKTETLSRKPGIATFASRHVDWEVGSDINNPAFGITVNGENVLVGGCTLDRTTGALLYSYNDYAIDSIQQSLRERYRGVVVDPAAGTVKFLRAPAKGAKVEAIYKPRAYRLTTDSAADVSPFALLDRDVNPRFKSGDPNNPFVMAGSSNTPRNDRLWVFWRKSGLDRPGGNGIHYKTYRYMVDLKNKPRLPSDAASITVLGVSAALVDPVEVDWTRNRLYFTAADAGKDVAVTYGGTSENATVELAEELGAEEGSVFGNLTSVMVNEGQVCAFKDPFEDRVWVFWTSTRSGNTDLYYETISPRLYGVQF